MTKHPEALIADFRKGLRGQADIDTEEVMWAIVDDIRGSYSLAIEQKFGADAAADIANTVDDYIANHYSDEETT